MIIAKSVNGYAPLLIPRDLQGDAPYTIILTNDMSGQELEFEDLTDSGNSYVYRFEISTADMLNSGQWSLVLKDTLERVLYQDICTIDLNDPTDEGYNFTEDDFYYDQYSNGEHLVAENAVLYISQELNNTQKAQARQNIGATTKEYVDEQIENIELTPGPQGPAGPQGPQGTQGIQGTQGPQGEQGPQGTQGTPGTNGQDGITPHIGENGNWFIGDTDTGVHAQGPQGEQGTQGIQGTQGEQGPQGTQGTQGSQGPQGEQGPAGPQGTQGTPGANGQDGITPHIDETTKHWMIGSTDTGVVAEGQQGPQGTQGIQGTQGPQGEQGPQGTQGTPGSDGITPHIDSTTGNWFIGSTDTGVHAQGPQGTQGIQGTQGPQGTQGTAGSDGITPHIDSTTNHWMLGTTDTGVNATGPQGPQGTQGIQGTQGPQGTAGVDGETAWVGTQQEYDNLPSYEQNKLYCITDGSPIGQIQSDWNQSNSSAVDYIKNKPTIPAAPVQSNWNESDSSSLAYIQNKPSTEQWIFTVDDGQGGTTTVQKNVYIG